MQKPDDYPVYSQKDVLEAFKNYDASEETQDVILYFISELTGISVDSLSEMLQEV